MTLETPSPGALFVALVLAPHTFARNKYFSLFQNQDAHRARRRAQIVRSILRDLSEPWPRPSGEHGAPRPSPEATIVEQTPQGDGVRLVYRVEEFDYVRTAHLSALEAAALRYALSKTGKIQLDPEDKERVEAALAELDPRLDPGRATE